MNTIILDCLARTAFSYDPSQPRDEKGRWSATGRSANTGHDMWIMGGFTYGVTAAAASLTKAEGWDDHEDNFGGMETQLADSLLTSIQKEKIRTTRYYSGHTSRPNHEVGDEIDIPLMAVTNSKGTASIYSDTGYHVKTQTAEARTAKVMKDAEKVLEGIRNKGELSPTAERQIIDAYLDISARGKGLRRPEHYNPPTTYEFLSNKSTPIRVNERVASGRYRVRAVEKVPIPGRVTYDPDTHKYADAHMNVVQLEFVRDLERRSPE